MPLLKNLTNYHKGLLARIQELENRVDALTPPPPKPRVLGEWTHNGARFIEPPNTALVEWFSPYSS